LVWLLIWRGRTWRRSTRMNAKENEMPNTSFQRTLTLTGSVR
jgi:hypothetical protein